MCPNDDRGRHPAQKKIKRKEKKLKKLCHHIPIEKQMETNVRIQIYTSWF